MLAESDRAPRQTRAVLIVPLAVVCVVCTARSGSEAVTWESVEKGASTSIGVLASKDPRGIAPLLHYPPHFSAAERGRDISQVGETIAVLIARFGSISNVKREFGALKYYEVGGRGGDLEYWKGLAEWPRWTFVYSVEFSKLGSGIVRVTMFQRENVLPEIESVAFGLLVTRSDARREIVEAMIDLMRSKGFPTPKGTYERLDAQLAVRPGS